MINKCNKFRTIMTQDLILRKHPDMSDRRKAYYQDENRLINYTSKNYQFSFHEN